MTADEFVAALKEAAGSYAHADTHPEHERTTAVKTWSAVPVREAPAFDHPPDPVLDLIARYDVTALKLGQFRFVPAPVLDSINLWHVATLATDEYYVATGKLFKMYYKADWPEETGLTPGEFLALRALHARMSVTFPFGATADDLAPTFAEYAPQAAAISPRAHVLDWFGEHRARFVAHKKTRRKP